MYVKRTKVDWEDKHHLDAPDLDNLATMQGASLAWSPGGTVHLERVPPFHHQEPPLFLVVEVDNGVLARNQLARSKVNMNSVFSILCILVSTTGLGGAADVDPQAGDIVGPVLGGNLGIGFDAILVRFMNAVGMVPACLDWLLGGGEKVLSYSGDDLIIIR
jgi:hypothetical protein